MSDPKYIKTLEEKNLMLEAKIKHLANDLRLTREELETATRRYLDIFVNMERKVEERTSQFLESEEQYRSVFTSATDAFLIINDEGKIVDANPRACNMYGYSHQEIICLSEEDIVPPDNKTLFAQIRENTEKEKVFYAESVNIRRNNTPFQVEIRGAGIIYNRKKHLLTIIRDIEAQRRTEEDLNKTSQALESSLQNLKETQDQLVESGKMAALGCLVAGVTHEINTPLGVGMMAASLLENVTKKYAKRYGTIGLKRSEFEKFMDIASESTSLIHMNLNRAANLVKHFKQVAIDQASEARRPFNLKQYIEEVLYSLRPKLKKTKHDITISGPDALVLDSYPGVFSQIITNLVINSLIHGFEEIEAGSIFFDIDIVEDQLWFRYTDNGRGMNEETLKKLYNPFFTTKRSHGGSGLGMHIVHTLVTQKLGGQIECTSSPGKGVSFLMKIPLSSMALSGKGLPISPKSVSV